MRLFTPPPTVANRQELYSVLVQETLEMIANEDVHFHAKSFERMNYRGALPEPGVRLYLRSREAIGDFIVRSVDTEAEPPLVTVLPYIIQRV